MNKICKECGERKVHCKELCHRCYNRIIYYPRHKERFIKNAKKWAKENPERRKEIERKSFKKHYWKNPEKSRKYYREYHQQKYLKNPNYYIERYSWNSRPELNLKKRIESGDYILCRA